MSAAKARPTGAADRPTPAGAKPLPDVTLSESRGVRYLHLGSPWIQGAMRLSKPGDIELDYVRRMMVWLLLRGDAERTRGHAVQLGLGAAAITRFCAERLGMKTTAVELNPQVVAVCRSHFGLGDDSARLRVLETDAAAFVADPARHGTIDVLCVDLYDEEAASPVLDSAGFYADCRAGLAAGGTMTVNLFGRDASYPESYARIAAAFGAENLLTLAPTAEGNTVVAAMKQVTLPGRAELARRAENIETAFGLPARKWLRLMRPPPDEPPQPLPELPPA